MKILLVGDYSNVHATLAKGLREIGHVVTIVSDGDGWKDYPRDVDVKRTYVGNRLCDVLYLLRLRRKWRKLRDFDVVQFINPVFLPLKAERIWPYYEALRKQNPRAKFFLGAFGMDFYWVKAGLDCRTFRYSDFNIGERQRLHEGENDQFIADWLEGAKGTLNKRMAESVDGIIAGLYEYYASYAEEWGEKLVPIPFPIVCPEVKDGEEHARIRFFIGIQKARSAYKGTDIMLRALERVAKEMPESVEIVKAESVPFAEYVKMFEGADVILDQLYSYTPAMNALEAMAKGLVVVGGAEPEHYALLGEEILRPIVNVQPSEESVYEALKELALHPQCIKELRRDTLLYIKKHHDHKKVAQQYLDFWASR